MLPLRCKGSKEGPRFFSSNLECIFVMRPHFVVNSRVGALLCLLCACARVHRTESKLLQLLPSFQIIRHFGFFRFIIFVMHLDVMSSYTVKTMNLEISKHLIIWDRGST